MSKTMMRSLLLAPFLLALSVASPVSNDTCDKSKCTGDCCCFSLQPPSSLTLGNMPQFVMLAFDGAVNINNMPYYKELLISSGRKNKKSGCKIRATFFVNHEYLDYTLLHELYASGQEVGLHSITHVANHSYWTSLNAQGWKKEVAEQRNLVSKLAEVNAKDIHGVRAPFLYTGGDSSFQMLKDAGFEYDASLPHMRAKGKQDPIYPYTLDYGLKSSCVVPPCPEKQYKGLWSVPLNHFFKKRNITKDIVQDVPCSMVDACVPLPVTEDETFQFLKDNFDQFYAKNKAPFPLFLHQGWLADAERKKGFEKFIDFLLKKEDVFFVTIHDVIQFMKNPKPLDQYVETCTERTAALSGCKSSKSCAYKWIAEDGVETDKHMKVCGLDCPKDYPWVH